MRPLTGTFRSLNSYNYRIWACGAIVSNIGTWMQRVGQDWVVLTQLTNNNATAVGTVMALQFAPQILLLPITGYTADRFEKRKVLYATQAAMGLVALILGVLNLTGVIQLWHVLILAFIHGCAAAFDSPARQSFVSELVGEETLSNAVALNSTSFNSARMIGPAIAGVLIASVGAGWVFIINAVSFGAVLCSLTFLKKEKLHRKPRRERKPGDLLEGFSYVWRRPDLKTVMSMLLLIGTFGLNFPIFISTMAVSVFHAGPKLFGLLTSTMAIGSVAGALLSARREKPDLKVLFIGATLFGIGLTIAALMPNYTLFGIALILVGVSVQTFTTTANGFVQLSTDPEMRGRVMAIHLAIALGTTPIGAPIVGWVADHFGPRWALAVGAAGGFTAALIGLIYLVKNQGLRLTYESNRFHVKTNPEEKEPLAEALDQ